MKTRIALFLICGLTAANAAEFAVASIKPSNIGGGNNIQMTPGAVNLSNVTLNICLKFAYGVQDSQIVGPDSLTSERYNIVAKAADPVGGDQLKLMMQSLLASRFRLVLHREDREQSVLALVVAKDGPKFQAAVGEGNPSMIGKGTLIAKWTPMSALADFLSGPMRTRVVDMTGLPGRYDFTFNLMAYLPPDLPEGKEPDVAGMVLTGLPRELGLRLESRKAPVAMLIVDRVEKPSEN